MRQASFAEAIESAIAQAMAADPRIIILGEDVHTHPSAIYSCALEASECAPHRSAKERLLGQRLLLRWLAYSPW